MGKKSNLSVLVREDSLFTSTKLHVAYLVKLEGIKAEFEEQAQAFTKIQERVALMKKVMKAMEAGDMVAAKMWKSKLDENIAAE